MLLLVSNTKTVANAHGSSVTVGTSDGDGVFVGMGVIALVAVRPRDRSVIFAARVAFNISWTAARRVWVACRRADKVVAAFAALVAAATVKAAYLVSAALVLPIVVAAIVKAFGTKLNTIFDGMAKPRAVPR